MDRRLFQKQSWAPLVFAGQVYLLEHLNEQRFIVRDSTGELRTIAVTFSDHCFTREARPDSEDETLRLAGGSRDPGYFCFDRYKQSLQLPLHLARLGQPRSLVWNVQGGNYAVVPVVDHHGVRRLYGIVFSLDRVTGLPVHLHMRVRTAYPCDERRLETFGSIRFEHLVALRMEGKRPKPINEQRRKRPSL